MSAAHLQGAGVDDVGGGALDEVHHIVKGSSKIQLVAVLLHIAEVGGADAVL